MKILENLDNITRWAICDLPITDQVKLAKNLMAREAANPLMATDRERRQAQTQFLKIQSSRINRRLRRYTS